MKDFTPNFEEAGKLFLSGIMSRFGDPDSKVAQAAMSVLLHLKEEILRKENLFVKVKALSSAVQNKKDPIFNKMAFADVLTIQMMVKGIEKSIT